MSYDKEREVKITGGTFFLCIWLFSIAWSLDKIAGILQHILDKMK